VCVTDSVSWWCNRRDCAWLVCCSVCAELIVLEIPVRVRLCDMFCCCLYGVLLIGKS